MKSLGQKIQQLEGMIDTRDVSDWENVFLRSMVERTHGGKITTNLSERQIGTLERIYARHFA